MKLKDNWIARNLILAAAFIIVLIISASVLLRVVTKHGKTVTAPDFTNLTVAQAQELAHSSHVSVKVVDSAANKQAKEVETPTETASVVSFAIAYFSY